MTNFDETRLFDSNFYDKNDIHNILKNNHAREQIRLIEMDDILEFLLYFFIQES